MDRTEPLLEPGFLGRLEQLQLCTRRSLAGSLAGDHRSRRYGTSIDFADYREYHPGDDFRHIDYNLLARLDILAIKLYEADDDLHVRLLVDTSGSMAGAKLMQAKRLAAVIGFVALVRRDTVTVHTMGSPVRAAQSSSSSQGRSALVAPRFIGRNAATSLFGHLGSLHAAGLTPFLDAAKDLLSRPGPQGLTVVISDLLTPEWESAISQLPARGADLMIVHVLDESELVPTEAGDFDLVDSETRLRVPVSLSEQTRADYLSLVERWLEGVAHRCRGINAGYALVRAEESVESLVLSKWCDEGLLR